MNPPTKALFVCAVIAAVFEVLQMFIIEVPIAAGIMAVLFLLMARLVRGAGRRRQMGAGVLAVMFLVDGGGVVVYQRTTALDYALQFGFAAFCIVGLVAAVRVLWPRRAMITS